MAKIYLSSTHSDLAQYREAVYQTLRQLRHDVVAMEDYVATDERPLDKCLSDVAGCDVYVGIIAWRYGYRPPGQDRSITELELREASRTGKPRLIFLLADDAPWPPKAVDADRGAIDRLRGELVRDHTVSYFNTPDQLAAKVSAAVTNVLSEGAGHESPDEVDPSRQRFYLTCLGRVIGELSSQIRFYSVSSCVLVAVGLAILGAGVVVVAAEMRLIVSLSGALMSVTTVFPVAVTLHARRRKALLAGLEDELSKDCPAAEVVRAVKSFLDHQLQLVMEAKS
jgi:hypothetical protein